MKKSYLFLIIFVLHLAFLQAQSLDTPIYTKDVNIPAYYAVKKNNVFINRNEGKRDKLTKIRQELKLSKESSLVLHDTLSDKAGGFHEIYKLLYKGIDVEGTKCIVHYSRKGVAEMINGNLCTINDLSITPQLSANFSKCKVVDIIKQMKLPTKYSVRNMNFQIDDSLFQCSEGKLLVFIAKGIPHLAYKHRVQSVIPEFNKYVYIDANTGDCLGNYCFIHDISSVVNTVYSGLQSIETQFVNGHYVLRDNSRGAGIFTLQKNGYDYFSYDNTWKNMSEYDRAAIDAHWGVEMTYDYYYKKFGRSSYDNNGSSIKSFVNYSVYGYDWQNAAWDGDSHCMYYGRYNGNTFASLDVTAHELTHGVTQYTSELLYEKESGAINEGLSDVFAVCVEKESLLSSKIWLIGENVVTGGIRDLSNPVCKYYHGKGWVDTNQTPDGYNDYCGVHTNSGVFGYWFYLLSNGGSGTNEAGISYSVSPIGIDCAAQICYLANSVFLCSNSTFSDARYCTIFAAKCLGYDSNVLRQINNAWEAVGVKFQQSPFCLSGPTNPGASSIYEIDNLPSECNVAWSFTSIPSATFLPESLKTNWPAKNQCVIDNSSKQYINGTLTAAISRNGIVITTLEKEIRSGDGFYATCSQPLGMIEQIHGDIVSNSSTSINFRDDAAFSVKKDALGSYAVTITSPYFSNATITHTPILKMSWKQSGNTIKFNLPANNNLDPVLVVTGVSNTDYTVFRFTIYPTVTIPLRLNVKNNNKTFMCEITSCNDDSKDESEESAEKLVNEFVKREWILTISNAMNGKVVCRKHVIGPKAEIKSDEWKSGIYIVNAHIGNLMIKEKLIVK